MSSPGTEDLIGHVKSVLLELNAHPYPEVACPPNVPRRASVALILRIQPNYNHWPAVPEHGPFSHSHSHSHSHAQKPHPLQRRKSSLASNASASAERRPLAFKDILDAFFDQDWVQHGDPELLFIKRATRAGDKWNGHVALPGGKRDPEDGDDAMTAVREALEEVGVDLSFQHAIAVGNLPQRVVTTSWGKVPLMVLCPYVYLLTSSEYPSQRLQPTEVASSHWVPLRALMSPSLRTHEYADVSNRLAKSELGIKRWFLQAMLSKMMFAAIRLLPSHSTYCASIPGFVPDGPAPDSSPLGKMREVFMGPEARYPDRQQPLLLWGLTLGVISDFLEHIPPHNALELWTYPTFTNWDVRFTMWAMSYAFRKRKAREMGLAAVSGETKTVGIVQDGPNTAQRLEQQETSKATGENEDSDEEDEPGEVGIAGLGVGRHWGKKRRAKMIARGAAVNSMLEGYYPIVRRAVATALVGRLAVVGVLAVYACRWYRRGG